MPKEGALRFKGQWQVYSVPSGAPFTPTDPLAGDILPISRLTELQWMPLEAVDPDMASLMAPYDDRAYDPASDDLTHVRLASTGAWIDFDQAFEHWQRSKQPLDDIHNPPDFGPGYTAKWIPGEIIPANADVTGSVEQRINRKWVPVITDQPSAPSPVGTFATPDEARALIDSTPELAGFTPQRDPASGLWFIAPAPVSDRPGGAFNTAQEAQSVIASSPALSGYQPSYDPASGLWFINQGSEVPEEDEPVLPRSFEELAIKLFIEGDLEGAQRAMQLGDQPNSLELLDRALQIARSPGDLISLMRMWSGDIPPGQVPVSPAFEILAGLGRGRQGGITSPFDTSKGLPGAQQPSPEPAGGVGPAAFEPLLPQGFQDHSLGGTFPTIEEVEGFLAARPEFRGYGVEGDISTGFRVVPPAAKQQGTGVRGTDFPFAPQGFPIPPHLQDALSRIDLSQFDESPPLFATSTSGGIRPPFASTGSTKLLPKPDLASISSRLGTIGSGGSIRPVQNIPKILGFPFPSQQGFRNLLPTERKALQGEVERAGVPFEDFEAARFQATGPSGKHGIQARIRPRRIKRLGF